MRERNGMKFLKHRQGHLWKDENKWLQIIYKKYFSINSTQIDIPLKLKMRYA